MRATENTEFGTPDVLRITEAERPEPKPHQVVVAVHASVVTQGDRRLRAADFPGLLGPFGRLMVGVRRPRNPIGGTMFAGRVVAIGERVTRFAVGDDVFGSLMHGAWAEYLAVGEDEPIATMPANASYAEAAAIPYGAGTSLTFLRDLAKVQPGERVLVVGGTGGVGRMAVQIAKHLGAHVTAVNSGATEDLARSLGADQVIDYRAEDFTARDERWDVIFDTTEGDHFRAFRGSLTERGRYLSLYVTARVLWEMLTTRFGSGPRAMSGVAMGDAAQMEELRGLVEAGAVRPVIAERFTLEGMVDAHRCLEAGAHGDVVVDVVSPSVEAAKLEEESAPAMEWLRGA